MTPKGVDYIFSWNLPYNNEPQVDNYYISLDNSEQIGLPLPSREMIVPFNQNHTVTLFASNCAGTSTPTSLEISTGKHNLYISQLLQYVLCIALQCRSFLDFPFLNVKFLIPPVFIHMHDLCGSVSVHKSAACSYSS